MLPKAFYRPTNNLDIVTQAFDRQTLQRICQMRERNFVKAFDMEKVFVTQKAPDNFYAFRDNGADILAVAHLDTVVRPNQRQCNFINTAGGPIVYSGALDDRLGAYTILDLLPTMGINTDVLLTVGEETGQSTAQYFDPPKEYKWVIEFDRGGTDVVMYQYDDYETSDLVEMVGAKVGQGTFSDIAFLEHLGVKAFNWGVGYQDYHSVRSHAYLDDYFMMIDYFVDFHYMNADTKLPHVEDTSWYRYWDIFEKEHHQKGDEELEALDEELADLRRADKHDYAAHDYNGHNSTSSRFDTSEV